MDVHAHWDGIHSGRQLEQLSWFRPHLDTSLALIEAVGAKPAAAILDVGGGASTLVDDLLARGFANLAVLDVSAAALAAAQERLGAAAGRVRWLCADITQVELDTAGVELWHDRACFHFLTGTAERAAYRRQLLRAVKSGGHVILSEFALSGPPRCSGLEVVRYDVDGLQRELGSAFRRLETRVEAHHTPAGQVQTFTCAAFVRR